MLEAIFQIFGEFVLQVGIEIFLELGLHSVASIGHRRPNPWFAAIGYTLLGGALGVGSLLLIPDHLMRVGPLRIANLVVTPILAGLSMAAFGAWRAHRGQAVLRIDRFSYGYLFALAFALVRYFWAA
ncbi:MAG: hypothetical protein ABI411_15820 [Tahibacter sp.]